MRIILVPRGRAPFVSTKNHDLWAARSPQVRHSHGLPVKSDKFDRLKTQNEYSGHAELAILGTDQKERGLSGRECYLIGR